MFDIIDAIEADGGRVREIVLNQEIAKAVAESVPADIEIVEISKFKPRSDKYFFGFNDSNKDAFLKSLADFKLSFANLVHPRAYLAKGVVMGVGNFVGAGSVIGPLTKLGDFNYINRLVSVGHDVVLGNFNQIGPGVTICGRCLIGNKNFIGAGATVIDGIKIKVGITLGAGGVLVDDANRKGLYLGVPAKLHKD